MVVVFPCLLCIGRQLNCPSKLYSQAVAHLLTGKVHLQSCGVGVQHERTHLFSDMLLLLFVKARYYFSSFSLLLNMQMIAVLVTV